MYAETSLCAWCIHSRHTVSGFVSARIHTPFRIRLVIRIYDYMSFHVFIYLFSFLVPSPPSGNQWLHVGAEGEIEEVENDGRGEAVEEEELMLGWNMQTHFSKKRAEGRQTGT